MISLLMSLRVQFFVISFFLSCEKGRPAKEASYYMGETTVEPPIRTVCEERW